MLIVLNITQHYLPDANQDLHLYLASNNNCYQTLVLIRGNTAREKNNFPLVNTEDDITGVSFKGHRSFMGSGLHSIQSFLITETTRVIPFT